jgi:hypothetical protein
MKEKERKSQKGGEKKKQFSSSHLPGALSVQVLEGAHIVSFPGCI